MTRPDSRDILGLLNYIADHIAAKEVAKNSEMITASEFCRRAGYKRGYISNKSPWRTPQFGMSGKLHTTEAWSAWIADEIVHRREWDAMGWKKQQELLGITA